MSRLRLKCRLPRKLEPATCPDRARGSFVYFTVHDATLLLKHTFSSQMESSGLQTPMKILPTVMKANSPHTGIEVSVRDPSRNANTHFFQWSRHIW